MSRANGLPGLAVLRSELAYDPDTGEFRWRRGRQGRNKDLSVSQSVRNGYRRIHINGKTYPAHRIAFMIWHGREPVGEIDHIDGDRTNNRISNLREATRGQNACNRPASGVVKHPKRKARPYTARIQFEGRQRHLGVFATYDEASAVYEAAKLEVFGEFSAKR